MSDSREFTYPSVDGSCSIHAVVWLPAGVTPRAVVQLVHGVAEHIGRYASFASWLADRGYLVVGEDHLGHGKTGAGGQYGFFAPQEGWSRAWENVWRLRELQGGEWPGIPYILLGHSMGSFLVRTLLIERPGQVDGAILSGTGQERAITVAFGKLLAELECRLFGPSHISPLLQRLTLGAYNRSFAPNRTGADWISRDEQVVDAYLADPLCTFTSTVGLYRDMLGAIQMIGREEQVRRMDLGLPIYLFSGDRDPVGSDGAGVTRVYRLFQEAGCRDVTLKLYPEGRHEMLNELNREEVYNDVLTWLETRFPLKR